VGKIGLGRLSKMHCNLVSLNRKRDWFNGLIVLTVIVIAGISSIVIFSNLPSSPDNGTTQTTTTTTTTPVDSEPDGSVHLPNWTNPSRFSEYSEYETIYSLEAPQYELEPNLSNVINLEHFEMMDSRWSSTISEKLAEHYFAAVPGWRSMYGTDFFSVYKDNFYYDLPPFVTTDALLHAYHVLFDQALQRIEYSHFTNLLQKLTLHMIEVSIDQLSKVTSEIWSDAALRNIAYFSVIQKLLDSDWEIPSQVVSWVEEVINLIESASGLRRDWFMGHEEDFSQYQPRGHYSGNETLECYFRAMMWLGRVTFHVWNESSEGVRKETAQAILLTLALQETSSIFPISGDAMNIWTHIYDTTCFFVGASDDLSPYDYLDISEIIYGSSPTLDTLQNDTKLTEFMQHVKSLRLPVIRTCPDPISMQEELGLRFMGQRLVPDSYVFQQLVFPEIGNRFLPTNLDFMYVLGSDRAWELLESEKVYVGYEEEITYLRDEFKNLTQNTWTQNLYWLWLYSFKPLLNEPCTGYPSFMLDSAWIDKQLLTSLGSWTELRHDTVLYAKQSTTPRGIPDLVNGYVEPAPQVFARLSSLCKMMINGLSKRCLLDDELLDALTILHSFLRICQSVAEKELSNIPLNNTEIERIWHTYEVLEHIEKMGNKEGKAAVVVDIHTDYNTGGILHEATGYPMALYVIVPTENGTPYIARGAMFSQYEFIQYETRLTDQEWWDILLAEEEPPMAEWVQSFVIEISDTTTTTEEFTMLSWFAMPIILKNSETICSKCTT
jgi:hypothetical protein